MERGSEVGYKRGRGKGREGKINPFARLWALTDNAGVVVCESMSSQKTILKSSGTPNQSHTPSTCQCENCVCVDSEVTGLSHH